MKIRQADKTVRIDSQAVRIDPGPGQSSVLGVWESVLGVWKLEKRQAQTIKIRQAKTVWNSFDPSE